MIDWNEVKVGETEIIADGYSLRKIIGVYGDWVWIQSKDCTPATLQKYDLDDWTIYDPWVEISEECEIDENLNILYKGIRLYKEDVERGSIKASGRRVWKRKEG